MLLGNRLALVRAAHLHAYLAVLRDLGTPVDRELAKSRLPKNIEDMAEAYVSVPILIEWVARTGRDLEPMELGLLAARKAGLSSLKPSNQTAILTAPSGLARLEALSAVAHMEDSAVDVRIRHEGFGLRIACDMEGLRHHPFICLAEWLNLQGIISVVRSIAGSTWSPSEMCFVSSYRVPEAVAAAFPDTRIRMGQPHTSLLVGHADLARPCNAILSTATSSDLLQSDTNDADPVEKWMFVSLLRSLIQPYLCDGRPDVAFAAEIAGISTRTLQRKLARSGSSFSQLLQEASFHLACRHLDKADAKVIDVAMMVGYDNPQHFARAFRRFAGITPTQYRLHALQHRDPASLRATG